MTLQDALVGALVVVSVALGSIVAIVVVHAVVARRWTRNRERRVATVRPAVIALAAADDRADAVEALGQLRRAEQRTLTDVAYEFLTKVSGVGRAALVDLLTERGVGADATRRLARLGAVGRARAASILGQLEDPASVEPLVRRLDDRDPEVRFVAARALGQLRDARAVDPLLASLTARRALPASSVAMWVLAIGPTAVAPLRDKLAGSEPLTRAMAAELLGHLGALEATDDLIRELQSAEEVTRARAARSLGRIGSPRAVAPMLAVLADGDCGVELRRSVVEAMGDIEDPSTLDALEALVGDADHVVARAAANGLVRLGPPGRRRLEAINARSGPQVDAEAATVAKGGVATGGAAAHAAEALARGDLADARRRGHTGRAHGLGEPG